MEHSELQRIAEEVRKKKENGETVYWKDILNDYEGEKRVSIIRFLLENNLIGAIK